MGQQQAGSGRVGPVAAICPQAWSPSKGEKETQLHYPLNVAKEVAHKQQQHGTPQHAWCVIEDVHFVNSLMLDRVSNYDGVLYKRYSHLDNSRLPVMSSMPVVMVVAVVVVAVVVGALAGAASSLGKAAVSIAPHSVGPSWENVVCLGLNLRTSCRRGGCWGVAA